MYNSKSTKTLTDVLVELGNENVIDADDGFKLGANFGEDYKGIYKELLSHIRRSEFLTVDQIEFYMDWLVKTTWAKSL